MSKLILLVTILLVIFNVQRTFGYNSNGKYNTTSYETTDEDVHMEYFLLDGPNPCSRTCTADEPPMMCRFNYTLEEYHTMSKACYDCPFNMTHCYRPDCVPADGVKRTIVTVNRKIPGPAIEVCLGDIITVDVINMLPSDSTTMHWHGQHQKNYPYMDGVPYVTQCPIPPNGNKFRYTFKPEQSGTHFWHSHIGMQRGDGDFGPLIVRMPKEEDPMGSLYDHDLPSHVMTIIDWLHQDGRNVFVAHHHNDGDNKPSSILINGLGRYKTFSTENNETIYTPAARFEVEQGYRYRFRVINAGFLNCPIEISVDNHTLLVLSSDGFDFDPVKVTSLVTYAGERFDFVLEANQDKGLYWIRFRGSVDCDETFTKAFQVAVLEYKGRNGTEEYPNGTPSYETAHAEGIQLNPLNIGTETKSSLYISMPNLKSIDKWDDSLKTTPDYQFHISYDFYAIDNEHFHKYPYYGYYNVTNTNQRVTTPQLNHISMLVPSFPLLSQRDEITDDMFCNENTLKGTNCSEVHCQCPHVIEVALHSVVEMIFVDEGVIFNANHPIHLHGFSFRVVAMERLGSNVTVEEVKSRDKAGLINRNLLNPPIKDTVTVPDGGYTIIRFKASNPGYWLLHCHLEFHAEVGMAMVIKVGEHSDMLAVPENFPKCGNYLPYDEPLLNGALPCCMNKLLPKIVFVVLVLLRFLSDRS